MPSTSGISPRHLEVLSLSFQGQQLLVPDRSSNWPSLMFLFNFGKFFFLWFSYFSEGFVFQTFGFVFYVFFWLKCFLSDFCFSMAKSPFWTRGQTADQPPGSVLSLQFLELDLIISKKSRPIFCWKKNIELQKYAVLNWTYDSFCVWIEFNI